MDGPQHYERAEAFIATAHADTRPNNHAFVANCLREAAVHAQLAQVAWDVFTVSTNAGNLSEEERELLHPWEHVTRHDYSGEA